MSECLLYLAVVDGKTKIGITRSWRNRQSTYYKKGANRVELKQTWNFVNRSTALSFEHLFLNVFEDYRIIISTKRNRKSEYITLSPEETRTYLDHVYDLMGSYVVSPPSDKNYTFVNLMPLLEKKLSGTLRKMNMVLTTSIS